MACELHRFNTVQFFFFIKSYIKFHVYKYCSRNLEALKGVIITEIRRIPQEILEKVMQNFSSCLEHCIVNKGHHLINI
ncbi:Uncharacterized protein FWK35_00017613 [Aphis craccivora]|uniref:Uncharacterized protein n=1 Tax=Aphis craccivora TaxID=307492 RepID=A0A6G0YZD2_APHCR|nr:Uncharacterized protein FWK35_00017613 [Aphis craccivora]